MSVLSVPPIKWEPQACAWAIALEKDGEVNDGLLRIHADFSGISLPFSQSGEMYRRLRHFGFHRVGMNMLT